MNLLATPLLAITGLSLAASSFGQMCMERPVGAKVIAFPAGTLLDGVGTSDMPMTSKSEKAKTFMRQGFAMIHCFWFDEAIRTFRDAVNEDPECAIAWGGLYLALTQPWNYANEFKSEAEFAIKRAVALSESASPAEQKLIVALRSKSLGGNDVNGPFEKAMRTVIADHPELKEPRLILAGIRCQMCMGVSYTPTGDVRGDLLEVNALIEPVLKVDPTNAGALHYHIHAWEPINPSRAVRSAELIGEAAPRSSHMVHMAGHIFFRVGRYADGSRVFRRARHIEESDGKTLGVTAWEVNWNYGHNRDFLAANLAEDGKISEALEAAEGMDWSKAHVYWRSGDWEKLMEHYRTKMRFPQDHVQMLYYRGMKACDMKQWIEARILSNQLIANIDKQVGDRPIAKLGTQMRTYLTMRYELEGRVLCLENKFEASVKAFEKSMECHDQIEYSEPAHYARPPHESMGWAMLSMGRPDAAKQAFLRGLRVRPNSYWAGKGLTEAKKMASQTQFTIGFVRRDLP